MSEKRKFKRFSCRLKARFFYYDGDPDAIDTSSSKGKKCKGYVLDISRGGMFISTDSNLGINRTVKVFFKTNSEIFEEEGIIVRTGRIANNPSEILNKFRDMDIREKAYVAIEFNRALDDFDLSDIQN